MTPIDSLPGALQHWQNFYMLTAAAAATLTGLMFVAVTFGSSLVTKATAMSARAFLDPIYMHFGQVLVTGCLMTIPTLTPQVLGCVLIVAGLVRLGGVYWVFGQFRLAQRKHGDIELSDWVASIALPVLAQGVVVTSGVGFWMRDPRALTGLAIVILALLMIGIYGAWEMLVWMALAVSERRERGGEGGT